MQPSPHAPPPRRSIGVTLGIPVVILLFLLGVPTLIYYLDLGTEYAAGYSQTAFDSIAIGDSEERVLELLGDPLFEREVEPRIHWLYCGPDHDGYEDDGGMRGTYTEIQLDDEGRVTRVLGVTESAASGGVLATQYTMQIGTGHLGLSKAEQDALIGKTREEVEALHGKPRFTREDLATRHLHYSRSPSSSSYRVRRVGIDATGKVASKDAYYHQD